MSGYTMRSSLYMLNHVESIGIAGLRHKENFSSLLSAVYHSDKKTSNLDNSKSGRCWRELIQGV
jgi:hypothetical protein